IRTTTARRTASSRAGPPRRTSTPAGGSESCFSDRSTATGDRPRASTRSEEHTSELQSRFDLVCRLLLEKKNVYADILCYEIAREVFVVQLPARERLEGLAGDSAHAVAELRRFVGCRGGQRLLGALPAME